MTVGDTITKWLRDTLGVEGAFSVEYPVQMTLGDYSTNIVLIEAKKRGKNPKELAEEFVAILNDKKIDEIEKIEVAGPGFINFFLKPGVFVHGVADVIEKKETVGHLAPKKEVWVVEHTSPNPNKAMHIGHLRNNLTGMALTRILEANGYTIICDAIDNNRGIAIAKLMWGYLKFNKRGGEEVVDIAYWSEHQDEWMTPEEAQMRPDRFVDELYVKGSADFDTNEEAQKKIRQLVVDWEHENATVWALWKKVLDYSYAGQEMTLKRLGNKWDFVWHEHEHYKMGKEYVVRGLEIGVFKKTEDGAILTNLEKYNLSDTIVQKFDGTSLYITQDIALTKLKLEKYKAKKLFWVIGPEQSLAMRQMFAICEQMGIGHVSDFTHIPYGYMSIKGQGKMSSRKGNVIFIDDVIDSAKTEIQKIIAEKETDIKNIDEVSEMLALGAVKFAVLKVGRNQDVAFDVTESTNLQGDSGPYLQYATVRAKSILKKAEGVVEMDTKLPEGWQTTDLERMIERFESVVVRAGADYAPHYIVTYLVQLAGEFNSFYAGHKIIDEGDVTSPYKLALTQSFVYTMTSGLNMLGISVPEEM